MKKRTRIGLGIAAGLFVLFLVVGISSAFGEKTPAVETVSVARGRVKKTVDISGTLEKATDVDLAFQVGGVVGGVPVVVGSTVREGDILAFLSGEDLAASADAAAATLAEAEANLALALAGATPEARAQSAQSVAQAQVALTNAQQALLDAQNVGNVSVVQAEANVSQTTISSEQSRDAAYVAMTNALTSGVAAVRDAVSSADSVLGIENGFSNDAFEDFLANLNPQPLNSAMSAFPRAADARDEAEQAVLAVDDDVTEAAAAVRDALAQSSTLLLYVAQTLSATSIDTREFSAADLAALQASIAADRATLANAQAAFSTAGITYERDVRTADDADLDAAQALTAAQASRDQNNAAAQASVANAEASLAARHVDDAATNAGPSDAKEAALRAAVSRAAANYVATLTTLNRATLTAPFDGIVTAIDYDVGEYVAPGMRMMRVQSSDDAFLVALDVPEADVADMAIGQNVHVTIDALGDAEFAGTILSLAPAQKDIEGAVFYEAKVVLTGGVPAMRTGMSADAVIDIAAHEGVLYLPQRAVLRKAGEEYIRIPADNEEGFTTRPVTIGLRGDDGIVEILDGVAENESVVLRIE